jgi:hypothetical protein
LRLGHPAERADRHEQHASNRNGVEVRTTDASGSAADRPFQLIVPC